MKRMTRWEIDPMARLYHWDCKRFGESNQGGHGLGISASIGDKDQWFVCFD
jgi:hypothetical protein